VIKRAKLLDKPLYLRFDTEAQGDTYVARLESLLDRGIVPAELKQDGSTYVLLAELIKDYLVNVSVKDSDKKLLDVLYARIGRVPLTTVNYQWVENWIGSMKAELNLAPVTIRHHVGALARCFDWAGRRNVVQLVSNPLRMLPKTYAQYNDKDAAMAKAFDESHTAREDDERDRRLEDNEEPRIRAILNKGKPEGRERPLELRYQAALELLFDLALESAMRLREMFTLTLDQTDLGRTTAFLDKTKNGNKRQVPLSSVAVRRIREYMAIVNAQERGMEGFSFIPHGRLFPWWDGSVEKKAKVSAMLSQQYARIFAAAECADLNFHDLRHEATSRFFERTTMSEYEIMMITGHSSTRMLKRYGNLRGSNLARKLW
jgi:integrase